MRLCFVSLLRVTKCECFAFDSFIVSDESESFAFKAMFAERQLNLSLYAQFQVLTFFPNKRTSSLFMKNLLSFYVVWWKWHSHFNNAKRCTLADVVTSLNQRSIHTIFQLHFIPNQQKCWLFFFRYKDVTVVIFQIMLKLRFQGKKIGLYFVQNNAVSRLSKHIVVVFTVRSKMSCLLFVLSS